LGDAGGPEASHRQRDILNDGRAVFNIAGNKYRIVVWINRPHGQYDKIDAQTV
jgi:mRNA interferase HigB